MVIANPIGQLIGRTIGVSVGSIYGKTSINFLSGAFPSYFTFTRASSATYFDANGVMQTATDDAPRFDHDPVTLAPLGLLMEGARGNSLLYSAAIGGTSWTNSGLGSLTLNYGTAPDGTQTSTRLVGTGTGDGYVLQNMASMTAVATYTFSVWIKGTAITRIRAQENGGDNTVYGTTDITATATWTRYTLTFTKDADGRSTRFVISGINTNSGVNDDFEVWGGQAEVGNFASSYIPTTSSAATRAVDVAYATDMPALGITGQAGTMIAEFRYSGIIPIGTAQLVCSFTANSGNDRNALGIGTSDTFIAAYTTGGVAQSGLTINTAGNTVAGTVYRAGESYETDNFDAFMAPSDRTVQADNTGTTFTPTRFQIGGRDGATLPMFGHVRKIEIYPTALPQAELIARVEQ